MPSKSVGSILHFSKIRGFRGTHGTHANYAPALIMNSFQLEEQQIQSNTPLIGQHLSFKVDRQGQTGQK